MLSWLVHEYPAWKEEEEPNENMHKQGLELYPSYSNWDNYDYYYDDPEDDYPYPYYYDEYYDYVFQPFNELQGIIVSSFRFSGCIPLERFPFKHVYCLLSFSILKLLLLGKQCSSIISQNWNSLSENIVPYPKF